ncbi:MAG TPA: ATP-dependent DNA helicase RecG [Gemmatimonadaceae bacterium]|nr:ATP-dependent DNA helicase RecG [Gemmatimonadaceae bacterium]
MASLDTNVAYLKGVGPRRADALKRLGVRTARDLLYHLPHRYHDASTIARISTLTPGMDATVIGTVISKGIIPTRKGLRIFQAVIKDRTGLIEAAWPGQPFLDRVVNKDDALLVTGRVRFFHGRQLQPREMVNLGAGSDSEDVGSGRVLAVYPATEGLSFKQIRAIVHAHLDSLLPLVRESLPTALLERAGVPPLREALRMVHRPSTLEEAERGRSRLALEELLFVSLLQHRAKELARERRAGISFVNKRDLTSRLKRALPFDLTGAQTRAIREIVADMCGDRRMHRLLQGDVGSGKTVVALFASLLALENGYQSAIMAPTELLAEQHARTFGRLLAPLGIEPVLVTGSLSAAERRARAARLAGTAPLIAVGTHALVQDDTRFGRLGFVAIDEQQRFGVEQRAALGAKTPGAAAASRPDVLLLSATPIPRSLALTSYGDLDISVLDERPPGRLPVKTLLRPSSRRAAVLASVEKQLAEGRQAYVVYPVIEESEKTDLKAAVTMHDELSRGPFAHRRVALLHGRLPTDERDAVMRQFLAHEVDVLVATTVVEVGIDVPNATVMLIEHPERFGLSQLHQLRGRVGRGAAASYCILLGDPGPETRARLEVFVGTDDGFEIARADLRLRGMGDLFGSQQSGEPTFRVADPLKDEALFAMARAAAEEILASDPDLRRRENAALRAALGERYARAIELFRVG